MPVLAFICFKKNIKEQNKPKSLSIMEKKLIIPSKFPMTSILETSLKKFPI